jgi:hypothetical protein
LEGGRSICESKGHHKKFIETMMSFECYLVCFSWVDAYLMVARSEV